MITVVLWKWYQENLRLNRVYTAVHINTMCAMIKRHLDCDHRIICITDDPTGVECETFELWNDHRMLTNATKAYLPSCYRRLKLYDQKTQRDLGIKIGDRIVGLDVDAVVSGPLFDLFTIKGDYIGWELPGGRTGRGVFNGSLQMFNSDGTLQFIWDEFKGNESRIEAANAGYHGSDQAWLSYRLMGRDGSVGIKSPRVVSYPLQSKLQGCKPDNVIHFFHGLYKPWDPEIKAETPWVRNHWRL